MTQSPPRIETFRRTGDGVWECRDVRDGTARLANGVVLELASRYDGLPA